MRLLPNEVILIVAIGLALAVGAFVKHRRDMVRLPPVPAVQAD